MTTHTLENLMELAKSANGKARQRTIGKEEANELLELIGKHQDDKTVHTIRVYSRQGFVPNSYKYRCEIRYFEARRTDDDFKVIATWGGAQRTRGQGALTTVNGRAA